jgi:hypothetical protein
MTYLFTLATSITGKSSVIDGPFHYSQHQRVTGLIFDALVLWGCIVWAIVIAYRNFGPPARRRAEAAAGQS